MANILIIDDDEHMRDMLLLLLERHNHSVMSASNGKVAENMCEQLTFDLVITDILMPVQEGMETIVMLKYFFPKIKIIAMTGGGKTNPEIYLEIARKLGAHFTLEKPFKHEEIIYAVNRTLAA